MKEEIADWLKSSDSKEYFELLKIPSVGADPKHLGDSAAAATWLKKWLRAIGAEVSLVLPEEVPSSDRIPPPVVFAEIKCGVEGAKSVLFYGHYDVQPPDPLDKWTSPPFDPAVRDGRVYCRGAQDDKGQFFAFLCGVRELVRASALKVDLKILLEGQEESGSGGLFALLGEQAFLRRIASDVMIVSDTPAAAGMRPAIVAGLRGVHHFTITLSAGNRDLHSGEYGGVAPNAAEGMARLIASLHRDDGSIAVEGFMDAVQEPSEEELAAASEGFPDDASLREDIGTEPCGGEYRKAAVRRNGFEPTIEINGIHTGYGGPGSKTVIPCEAVAKISMRLVPGQNPLRSYEAVKRHLAAHCPRGTTLAFSEESGLSPALKLPLSSPLFYLASCVLSQMDPRGPVFKWNGASIPVVSALKEKSGAAALLVGWGQSEDNIHSPDESFSVGQFLKTKEWAKRILAELG